MDPRHFFNRPGPRAATSLPLDLLTRNVPSVASGPSVPALPYVGPAQPAGKMTVAGRQVSMLKRAFIAVNTAPISILVAQSRAYLFIQNQSGVSQMVFSFGVPPGAAGIIPVDGEILGPGLGAHEYDGSGAIPNDELWVLGAAAQVPGVVFYALDTQ